MVELLAKISGTRGCFERLVRQTALWPDEADAPYFEQMLFRLGDGWVDTPAGAVASAPAVYLSLDSEYFDEFSLHTDAPFRTLLSAQTMNQLLACIGDAHHLSMELYGDPETRFATEMHVEADETTVQFDRMPDAGAVVDVPDEMPKTFEDGRFHVSDGMPAPTVVETTTDALSRVIEAVDAMDGSSYPLVVSEGGLMLDLARRGVLARATLYGDHVEGPTVHNLYGDEFARAVQTLDGPVRLETSPDGPLALVRDTGELTNRIVVPAR